MHHGPLPSPAFMHRAPTTTTTRTVPFVVTTLPSRLWGRRRHRGVVPTLVSLWAVLASSPRVTASAAAGQETLLGIVGRDFVLLGADASSSSGVALTSRDLDKILALTPGGAAVAAAGDAADADRLLGLLQALVAIRAYEGGGADVACVFDGSAGGGTVATDDDDGLDVESVAHCARREIASALRSAAPLRVCLLLGGMVRTTTTTTTTPSPFSDRLRMQLLVAQRQIHGDADVDEEEVDEEEVDSHDDDPLLRPRLVWLDEYGSLQRLEYGAHGLGANFCLSVLDQGYRPDMTRDEALQLMRDCFDQLKVRFVINSQPTPPCIKCVDATGCRLL